MYRSYKIDYGKYLNSTGTKVKKTRKEKFKLAWSWTKLFLFVFLITTMLWGCVQGFQPKYAIGQVSDMTGRSFFNTGVNFEIILRSLGDKDYSKTFWYYISGDSIYSYQYIPVTSWGDAFRVTKSPYYGLFVYPMSWLLVFNIKLFNGWSLNTHNSQYGVATILAIFFTCFIIKLLSFLTSIKSSLAQDKMIRFQAEQQKIKNKYKNDKSKESKQKMQMELIKFQKKQSFNPYAGMINVFMLMPILYSLYTTVRMSHMIKISRVGQIYLTDLPWTEVKNGRLFYLSFFFLYETVQILSGTMQPILQIMDKGRKHESIEIKKQRKKQIYITLITSFVFIFFIAQIPVGVCIYWIFSSFLQIIQTIFIHYFNKHKPVWAAKRREKIRLKLKEKAKELHK